MVILEVSNSQTFRYQYVVVATVSQMRTITIDHGYRVNSRAQDCNTACLCVCVCLFVLCARAHTDYSFVIGNSVDVGF